MNETSPFCLPKEILKKIVTASRDSKSLQQFMGCMSIWGGFGLWSWLCNLQSFLGGGLVTESCLTLETPQTGAHQAPLSMGFPRHEYWNGLSFPSSGDLPDPGIKPVSSVVQVGSVLTEAPGKPPQSFLSPDKLRKEREKGREREGGKQEGRKERREGGRKE